MSYFTKYGDVQKAYIIFDPKTNKNKDFGFIEFKDAKSADLAFREGHHLIETCMVTVHRYGRRKKLQVQDQKQASESLIKDKDSGKSKAAEYVQKSKKKKKKRRRKNPGAGDQKKSTRRLFDLQDDPNNLESKQKDRTQVIHLEQIKDQKELKVDTNLNQIAENENAAQEGEENDEDDTPNQDSSENKYADLVKNLEIFSEKDRKTRLMEIVELSLLKQSEENYYLQTGVDVSSAYRVNNPRYGDTMVDNRAY